MGGPVTIIKMSAATAESGIWNLVNFVGFLSVNLAVFNLLPFPALDGGWCVILLIELITRRKVPDKDSWSIKLYRICSTYRTNDISNYKRYNISSKILRIMK